MSYRVSYKEASGLEVDLLCFANSASEALAHALEEVPSLKLHPNRVTRILFED